MADFKFADKPVKMPPMRRSHVVAIRKELIRVVARKTSRFESRLADVKRMEKRGLKGKEPPENFLYAYSIYLDNFFRIARIESHRIASVLRTWP